MTTIRERLLPVVAKMRVFNDTQMGLRRFTAYKRSRVPSDARGGIGATYTVTDTLIAERFRARAANSADVVKSGGRVQLADWLGTLITPRNDADTYGTPVDALTFTASAAGEKTCLVLVGVGFPDYLPGEGGGEFTIVDLDQSRNFAWSCTLRPSTGRLGP